MSHGPASTASDPLAPVPPALAFIDRSLAAIERALMVLCSIAVVLAALVLTYSVGARYFFKIPTDWQDECAVFLLVGATFLSAGFVQRERGHVGIEALGEILPPAVNRARRALVDLLSLLFCGFFAWKSWTLLHEAIDENQHSSSTWGPPLWIPYSLMSVGMTLLAIRIAAQLLRRLMAR